MQDHKHRASCHQVIVVFLKKNDYGELWIKLWMVLWSDQLKQSLGVSAQSLTLPVSWVTMHRSPIPVEETIKSYMLVEHGAYLVL